MCSSEQMRSPTDYKTWVRVYHGFRFDSDGFAAFVAKQESTFSTGFVPGCEHLNPVLDSSDSTKISPETRSENTESKAEGEKERKTETNLGAEEKNGEISAKFCGDTGIALNKAVNHLAEKRMAITVKNMQTYFMMNNTEISDRLCEKYLKEMKI